MSATSDVPTALATLIGDVVGSRTHPDQGALLGSVAALLTRVTHEVAAIQPPALTIGDEFQGAYATIGDAVAAMLRCRLHLDDPDLDLPESLELRFGIGYGDVVHTGAATPPFGQSGPGWWSARAALEAAAARPERSQWPRTVRSAFRRGDGEPGGATDALLICLDELVGRMDRRSRRILLAVLGGRRQADVAAELGISQPAVAKRLHADGISAVVRALALLRGEEDT